MPVRERIQLNDTLESIIVKMAEGNPGATTAMCELVKGDPLGMMMILDLDDMGMRGSMIWVAFNEYCKRDAALFKKCCRERDPKMVAKVNSMLAACGNPLPAATHGRS